VFTLLVIMIWMLLVDFRLALVSFAVIPFVFAAARLFQSTVRRAYRDIRVKLARINAFLQEHLSECGWSSCSAARRSRPSGSTP